METAKDPNKKNLIREVSVREPISYNEGGQTRIIVIDCGVKHNILRSLIHRNCHVVRVPCAYDFFHLSLDGVVISNGPGDPEPVTYAIETVKQLAPQLPTFGICLGHQILSLALGARSYKLSFGHRGANHPVRNLQTGKVEITSQNHGFAIATESLPAQVEITHTNLNDNTLEGLRCTNMPAFSVQYHPEASPGPHDASYHFSEFVSCIEKFSNV